MGILTRYFAAPGDDDAAAVLRDPDGPAAVPAGATAPVLDTVALTGVDPFVMLGTVASHLTGRPYAEVAHHPRHASVVAVGGDEGPWVVTVSDGLAAELARAAPVALRGAAARWSVARDLVGAEPIAVAAALEALAALAGRAAQRGERVYCWTCLDADPASAHVSTTPL